MGEGKVFFPRHAFKLEKQSALRIFVSGTDSAQKLLSKGASSLSTPLGVPESHCHITVSKTDSTGKVKRGQRSKFTKKFETTCESGKRLIVRK